MKKIYKISTLAGLLGLVGGGLAGVHAYRGNAKEAKALDPENYIVLDSNFFTNWNTVTEQYTRTPGVFRNEGATYWDQHYPFNAFGNFFDGCTGGTEGWKGTLTSRKWRQNTQYIYYEWGCANNNHMDEESDVRMEFKLYRNEDDTEPYKTYKVWNDTFSKLQMVLRNFHISDEDYTALNGDFYMSIDFIDGRENEYGAHVFGNLHVNQTLQDVSDAQWYYYKNCEAGEETVAYLRSHYYLNGNLREGFETSFYESFNTQESFNQNFILDSYGNNTGERHADKAISHSTFRTGSNMPFNNDDGFFKGWYGGADQDKGGDQDYGYVAHDNAIYRFVSKPFRLPENGIVSVKMAGRAASLHLIDFDGGHGDLAWVDCKTSNTEGIEENIALSGRNEVTLVKHIVNFSKYAGRLVQLGIADVHEGGWQCAYFDELHADYDELPSLKVEYTTQTATYGDPSKTVTSYAVFNDRYVTSVEGNGGVDYALDDGPATDESPLLNASAFVDDYMAEFRNGAASVGYCSKYTSDEAKALLTQYNGLTEAEQRIVCDSDDYQRVGATAENWYTIEPTYNLEDAVSERKQLGYSIAFLAGWNNVTVKVYDTTLPSISIRSIDNAQTTYVVIAVVGVISIVSLLAFLAIKKRKENN